MEYPKARTDIPQNVVSSLIEAMERINVHDIASQLWETEFSPTEQEQLGINYPFRRLPEAYAALKGISFERAVLDLGVAADVVTPSRRRLLLNQLGEDESGVIAAVGQLPRFDSQTGNFYYGDAFIVRLQPRNPPSNLYCILDGFQRSGWKRVIVNPLLNKSAETPIHNVLQQLKKKTAPIDFGVQDSGTQIYWKKNSVSEVSVN